jgi:hypothetical protein
LREIWCLSWKIVCFLGLSHFHGHKLALIVHAVYLSTLSIFIHLRLMQRTVNNMYGVYILNFVNKFRFSVYLPLKTHSLSLYESEKVHASHLEWDLAEWLERCASIPMITGSNPSGGSELTFPSGLLLTARDGST